MVNQAIQDKYKALCQKYKRSNGAERELLSILDSIQAEKLELELELGSLDQQIETIAYLDSFGGIG